MDVSHGSGRLTFKRGLPALTSVKGRCVQGHLANHTELVLTATLLYISHRMGPERVQRWAKEDSVFLLQSRTEVWLHSFTMEAQKYFELVT